MAIIVGKLNVTSILGGYTACVNNTMIFLMFNLAVTITANAVLGKAVGEGRINQSKNIIKLTLAVCVIICLWTCIVGILIERLLAELFCVGE